MTRLGMLSAVSAALLLGSGCSTIYDASGRTPLGEDGPHIYGGTRTIFLGDGFSADYLKFAPILQTSGGEFAWGVLLLSPVAADIALSLAIDTIIFPYTLSREIHER